MKNLFLIRTAAIKLLEKIYLQSYSGLKASINVSEMITKEMNSLTFQKASRYLISKHFVESSEVASNVWTATITYAGIDWLEECHNFSPMNPSK